jgi:hypothetical protein
MVERPLTVRDRGMNSTIGGPVAATRKKEHRRKNYLVGAALRSRIGSMLPFLTGLIGELREQRESSCWKR